MNQNGRSIYGEVTPFVDGRLSESESQRTIDVINPSTGKRCGSIPSGCEQDVNSAVQSACRAFSDGRWSEAAPSFRKRTLHCFADLIAAEASLLDGWDAVEMGKPISEPFANAASAADLIRYYAETIDKITGEVYCSDMNSLVTQRRVPRGVVGAIVPWNFPTYNAVVKLGPALAAGNCVVLKPSELSSRSAVRLAELGIQAGLPPGVLNVVPGLGETVGRALGLHMQIDLVTFTGSTDVGKRLQQYAGQSNMKVVIAECGGKSPQIVFDDGVDLDAVSESIVRLLLTNQGQICSVGSRLLVQRSIEDAVLDRIAARFAHIVMGDATDPKTTFGPLASVQQCAKVMRYIESAEVEGARLVTGGHRALPDSGGNFIAPTLFRNVSPTARIAQEEIFGPVLTVIAFDDEADAIRMANSTVFGLIAYVWTTNLSTGMRLAKGIRSPVLINAAVPLGEGPGHACSIEPSGQSGIGIEGGIAGVESYMRHQLVWINHG